MFYDTLRFHILQNNGSVWLHFDYPNWTVHLKIFGYIVYTGYKGKIEEDGFWKGYMYLIQTIYLKNNALFGNIKMIW